jgi:negative regulator of flagellin synthesis FlgM
MRINGDKGLLPQNTVRKAPQEQQGTTEAGNVKNADKVSFSAVLQQASETQSVSSPVGKQQLEGLNPAMLKDPTFVHDVSETQQLERANKIEELKLQVADGSYKPDLNKVASSLLQFLAEGRQA